MDEVVGLGVKPQRGLSANHLGGKPRPRVPAGVSRWASRCGPDAHCTAFNSQLATLREVCSKSTFDLKGMRMYV